MYYGGVNLEKVLIEFINTWSSCDGYTRAVEVSAAKYKDKVDVKIYYAGKDFDYIKKYGVIFKGTMIINGKKKIDRISKDIIDKEIREAVMKLEWLEVIISYADIRIFKIYVTSFNKHVKWSSSMVNI